MCEGLCFDHSLLCFDHSLLGMAAKMFHCGLLFNCAVDEARDGAEAWLGMQVMHVGGLACYW